MIFTETILKGCYIIEPKIHKDDRGSFVKTFHKDTFKQKGLCSEFRESFFSVNEEDVIRGMHYQDTAKLVYVTKGSVLDVVLDPKTGKYFTLEMSAENGKMVYIPKEYAHGFKSLKYNTCMVYLQEDVHNAETEGGYRYDSFGFDWQTNEPIISARDLAFPKL